MRGRLGAGDNDESGAFSRNLMIRQWFSTRGASALQGTSGGILSREGLAGGAAKRPTGPRTAPSRDSCPAPGSAVLRLRNLIKGRQ